MEELKADLVEVTETNQDSARKTVKSKVSNVIFDVVITLYICESISNNNCELNIFTYLYFFLG